MTTFLEIVNKVFLRIGEQRVNSVTSNEVSILCGQNVNTALVQLAQDYPHWPWLSGIYSANSWNVQEATLDPTALSIRFIRDAGSTLRLEYETEEVFFRRQAQAYTGTNGGARYYTVVGEKFYLHPYPNDSESQLNIKFHGSFLPSKLVANTDELPVSMRDEDLIIMRAAMNMAADHLKNVDIYRVYSAEYQRLLQSAKARLVTDITDKRRSAIR